MRSLLLFLLPLSSVLAEPLLNSWFTDGSTSYAKIYESTEDENLQNASTTWKRAEGIQQKPAYAGLYEVSHTNDWVYFRTSNLASYVTGPWYLNFAKTNPFPNFPKNQNVSYRLPRQPTILPAIDDKRLTGAGTIGYMVNGVSIYDSRDTFYYDSNLGTDVLGSVAERAWSRNAYEIEGVTFDKTLSHQGRGVHHYHAQPIALRYQLGDSIDFAEETNTYTENFNGEHSPIIGWMRDGLPLYGPYGYSSPLDESRGVRRMITGYQLRNLQTGAARDSWPAWATRLYAGRATFANGPAVEDEVFEDLSPFFLGRYLEDYDYKGDVGLTQYDGQSSFDVNAHYDLNEYNVRFCVTPEFPAGTWAYFTCIESDGEPVFPFNIGRAFYGNPSGGRVDQIPDSSDNTAPLTEVFKLDVEMKPELDIVTVDPVEKVVSLSHSQLVEGGQYTLSSSSNLSSWDEVKLLGSNDEVVTQSGGLEKRKFFQTELKGVAPFDSLEGVPTEAQQHLTTITLTVDEAPEDLSVAPLGVTVNSTAALFVARPSRFELQVRVDADSFERGTLYEVSVEFPQQETVGVGTYLHTKRTKNVVLMIVDDWGIDSSPVDNVGGNTRTLPQMPNLVNRVQSGVQFTNAYAMPKCSPTRATILTGRYAFRTGVGDTGGVSIPENEFTLPEALFEADLGITSASFGKWHLGGVDTGARDTGWPFFTGTSGNIAEGTGTDTYNSYAQLDTNGTETTNTVYSTTEITQNAMDWIGEQGDSPWFCWVGYHAPHSPYEQAPATVSGVSRPSEYTNTNNNRTRYESMLWALDVEMERLISSVDLTETTVIIIGDNGTGGNVIDTPFSNDRSKGTLYDGGTHVPCYILGAAVDQFGSDDSMVMTADFYPTVLDLLGVNSSELNVLLDGKSLVPILEGSDTEERVAIVEAFGNGVVKPGRVLRSGDYKLYIVDDPLIQTDSPGFEFYNVALDANEQDNLTLNSDTTNLNATELQAFTYLLDRNAEAGGAYNYTPDTTPFFVTLDSADSTVPALTRNGSTIAPRAVTLKMAGSTEEFEATYIARRNSSGVDSRYSVEINFDPQLYGIPSGSVLELTVSFNGNGGRNFSALNQFIVP